MIRFIVFLLLIPIKLISFFLKLFHIGGGTSLPGLIMEKYFPSSIKSLSSKYKKIILITGTNGKTTTQKLLRKFLEQKKIKVVSNRSGANLFRGIVTTLVLDTNLLGKNKSDIAILEVEEATMPILTKHIQADYIVVTNLFRDQLDAYGEVVQTRKYILDAILANRRAVLSLPKDDVNVITISGETKNKYIGFSIKCDREIFSERKFFRSKRRKSYREIYVNNVKVNDDLSTSFDLYGIDGRMKDLKFKIPGIQNLYSVLAALSVASDFRKYKIEEIREVLSNFNPAFGRGEIINIRGKKIRLFLIKNPASFTANLNMLKRLLKLNLMIIINDKIADGRDVSWLWDAEVEMLSRIDPASLTISGERAYDMALRAKYADLKPVNYEVESNLSKAFDFALSKIRSGEELYILPTYTAMLEIRKLIGNIVKIKDFWK